MKDVLLVPVPGGLVPGGTAAEGAKAAREAKRRHGPEVRGTGETAGEEFQAVLEAREKGLRKSEKPRAHRAEVKAAARPGPCAEAAPVRRSDDTKSAEDQPPAIQGFQPQMDPAAMNASNATAQPAASPEKGTSSENSAGLAVEQNCAQSSGGAKISPNGAQTAPNGAQAQAGMPITTDRPAQAEVQMGDDLAQAGNAEEALSSFGQALQTAEAEDSRPEVLGAEKQAQNAESPGEDVQSARSQPEAQAGVPAQRGGQAQAGAAAEPKPGVLQGSAGTKAETQPGTRAKPQEELAPSQPPAGTARPEALHGQPGMDVRGASGTFQVHEAGRLETRQLEMIQQVSRAVDAAVQAGRSFLRMQLNPADLGAIDIRLASSAGAVSVQVYAEQAQTGRMLEAQLNQLRQTLADAGVQLTQLNVHYGGAGAFTQAGQPRQGGFQGGTSARAIGREASLPAAEEGLEILSPARGAGGVDYRI